MNRNHYKLFSAGSIAGLTIPNRLSRSATWDPSILTSRQMTIELCHIGRESTILDVGCGVGATACFIAAKVGCRVVGVDIPKKMVERSRERAIKQKLTHRVEFRVADVHNLPFENNLFDNRFDFARDVATWRTVQANDV